MELNDIVLWLPGYTVTPLYTRNNTKKEDYINYKENIEKDKELKLINDYVNKIRQGRDKFAEDYVLPAYMSLSNPVAYVASITGGKVIDELTKSAGFDGFGDLAMKGLHGKNPIVYELLNPGYLLGGAGLSNNARRLISSRSGGVRDAIQYGILDRLNALKTYKNVPTSIKRNLIPVLDKGIILQGLSVVDDRLLANGKINMGWNDKVLLLGDVPYTADLLLGALLGPGSIRAAITPRAKNAKEVSKALQLAFAKGLKNIPSGSTLSGNAPAPTLGLLLNSYGIYDMVPERLHKFIKPYLFLKGGISSKGGSITEDAYKSILKYGNTKGHSIHYTPGVAGDFKGNSYLARMQLRMRLGKLDVDTFVDEFNAVMKLYGGRPAHVNLMGLPVVYHPAIYFK